MTLLETRATITSLHARFPNSFSALSQEKESFIASADFSRDSASQITLNSTDNTSSTQSAEAQSLGHILGRLASQRNRRQTTREIVRALGIGAALCAPLVLLHRLYILDLPPLVPLSILLVALIVGAGLGWRARVGSFEAARDADKALGLEDRLASALSIAQPQAWRDAKTRGNTSSTRSAFSQRKTPRLAPTTAATSFVPALLHDASMRAGSLDPKAVYPAKFDTRSKWCLAALALLLAFTVMPDWDFLRSSEDKKLAATLTTQGAELEQIAKPILKKNDIEASAQTKKLAARMNILARQMQRGRMNRGQALLGIGELKRDLEKAAQNQTSTQSSDNQRLQDALKNADMQSDEGKSAKAELQKNDAERAADQLDKLADKIESGNMTRDEKQKAANDLEKAAKALRENGQSDGAKKLEDAAKSLREQAQGQQAQGQQQGTQKQNGQKNGGQQQQNGQQKNGQQNGDKKSGSQNGQQNQKSQNGQNQGQKSQNGGSQQNQNGQKGQSQQQQSGQQSGQQKGQNGGQQSQSQQNGPKNQQSQNGQNQGQQDQNGQSSNGQQGDGATQGGSQALRDMANGMRGQQGQGQGGGNSKNLQDMLNKIKEAERNSGGQNSGQNPSQGQSGSGSMPGQNGQSLTPGKDLMPTDPKGAVGGGAGLGSRNNAKGVQSGGGVSNIKAKRTGDKRRWSDVWSDRLPKTRKGLDKITGKMGANGEMEQLQTQTEAKGGKASAPYYNVYESYKKDAEDAVAREAVPPAYKQPVKDYFESLKP